MLIMDVWGYYNYRKFILEEFVFNLLYVCVFICNIDDKMFIEF